ncbi:Nodule Cysteine-Rich (NCR) secreted peptide [Medicago truncatula]|uniref:Nodule Cysteine-Rich (NCR) secreted peptide n=1 Tax=Medicago truncatula TaxID=3880 RepID=G7JLZ2_MEDTR|nr:Nodule Cysteine-Rich (NCR) secreted peptide [Medicago truncatula]KEH29246.1 Nodule Cysteine-Rich (NCR) secreted peptide [Medicago truncatula]
MAKIIFYVYALIILFSPFLAARLVFVNREKPCVTDADCHRYRHESAINVVVMFGTELEL